MAAATTSFALGALAGAAPASAHVRVDADEAVSGESATLTFRVPNESEAGSPTTGLRIALPNLTSVSTAVMPGWTAKLDRDDTAGTVSSITWSAEPGSGIGTDQFGLFVVRAKLPESTAISFPTIQTYADGTVVHWEESAQPDGQEPEHPAPVLALTASVRAHDGKHASAINAEAGQPVHAPDNVARGLAGAALLVAGLGTAAALVRRRA